jgi:hypothetical protein
MMVGCPQDKQATATGFGNRIIIRPPPHSLGFECHLPSSLSKESHQLLCDTTPKDDLISSRAEISSKRSNLISVTSYCPCK